jgi:hypothetical protein
MQTSGIPHASSLVGEPVTVIAQLPGQRPLAQPLAPRGRILVDHTGSTQFDNFCCPLLCHLADRLQSVSGSRLRGHSFSTPGRGNMGSQASHSNRLYLKAAV